MKLADIKKHNITDAELERIYRYEDGLSDFCETIDGRWGIEWDGIYGRHWDYYDTKEEAEAALDRRSERQLDLLLMVREELAAELKAKKAEGQRKAAKKKAEREAKTLGGQHPVLAALLVKARNEHRKTA